MYIIASSTISHQPTFRNKGFSSTLSALNTTSELITPDYSPFIPAMDRRRMSSVLKMAISCSIDCLEQAGLSEPDGIIVGTSMGCCTHTRIFLDKIIESNDGPLAPTSFIVSTHNTIAGQISLLLKNHGYNMTHTQNSLSFEQSLIDGVLCINNGCNNILVGGADEEEGALYNINERLNDDTLRLISGASFFILSKEKASSDSVTLTDVGSFGLIDDSVKVISEFLDSNNVTIEDIDLVLYASSRQNKTEELKMLFRNKNMLDYQKLTGAYFTNSAFAMHIGVDLLSHRNHSVFGERLNNVLVCNHFIPENLGLILLSNKNN